MFSGLLYCGDCGVFCSMFRLLKSNSMQEQLEKSSKEQKSLKEAVTMLRNEIEAQDDKTANVLAFVEKVKRYTEIKELTPAIVNEFIDYIMVSKSKS